MNVEVERILDLAAAMPPSQRAGFLAKECPDTRVRAEVESLLRYVTGAETYFEQAIQSVASSVRSSSEPSPGDTIGVYRIESLLGRGGMGNVYLAVRADGELQQQVAIKVLRADCYRPEWRKRFLTERQVLASLQHPSIVHVMDAGHTEEGRPYLVMEYVDGVPIDVYASKIAVREKLKLFLGVCDGVSHAHRRLVIHRDLKPSNIFVDSSGQPKLLDFGIAKLLNDGGGSADSLEHLLTPNYASPEQLAGAVETTASDVYSLGVVLYELLTRTLPHSSTDAAQDEIVPARRINPGVPADVDFILRKAMRPDPDSRYVSVDELASDLEAALASRPVKARAGNGWYRLRKFLRRRWLPVAATAAVVGSLAGGLYVTNRERAIAEHQLVEVRKVANKLFDIDAEVAQMPGGSKTRQMIVDTALGYLQQMSGNVGTNSALALDLGTAYMRVARVQGVNISPNLGQTEQADIAAAKAQALVESVLAGQPQNRTALLRAAQIAHDRMILAGDRHHDEDALKFARNSAARLEQYLRTGGLDEKSDRKEAQQVILTHTNVANRYMIAGAYDDAIRICGRGIEIARATNWPTQAGSALMVVALSERARGNLDQALQAIRESLRLLEPAPDDKKLGRVMAYSLALVREAQILGEEDAISFGRSREAVERLQRSMDLVGEFERRDPSDFSTQYRVYTAETKMAHILTHTDPNRALELYDDGLKHLNRLAGNGGTTLNEVRTLAASTYPLMRLGRTAETSKRLEAAFARLAELKLYPAQKIELGSAADDTLRASAEYEAATGDVTRGAEIYRELLQSIFAGRSEAAAKLSDAVELSGIYRASARLHRLARQSDQAELMESRRLELWQRWDKKLPNNAFVLRQLDAARSR